MQAYVDANGGGFKIAPWDYYYYQGKVKKQKFDLDEAEVRPYLSLENASSKDFSTPANVFGASKW